MKVFAISVFVFSLGLSAQQAAEKPSFEVVAIKPGQAMSGGRILVGMQTDKGMLRYTNVSLKECIRTAYRVKDYQVDGPDWIASTRFDIQAKLPAGSSEDQIPEMLQAMLAERFKLTVRRDTKEHAVYALIAAKSGPKLKPAEKPVEGAAPGGRGGGRGQMMIMADGAGAHLRANASTLSGLAETLSRFTDFPVVDMTGIDGEYDFDLVFSPETMRGVGPGGAGPSGDASAEKAGSIYDSVQRYGLKLESRKAPMETVSVDHIEKVPTEN